ncbi:MAG: hypothetical protein EDR02_06975 [Actinobacteria bacterium]|nr:MAG: hypothetical protein EDR02_06975 [Actinomycetota bacterium]RIK07302.1 MAG: hypothetical protein DCC48_04275 [Acidobacteriota bacterium]
MVAPSRQRCGAYGAVPGRGPMPHPGEKRPSWLAGPLRRQYDHGVETTGTSGDGDSRAAHRGHRARRTGHQSAR